MAGCTFAIPAVSGATTSKRNDLRLRTFLLATRNEHKVIEIGDVLGAEFQFLTLNTFPAAPPVIEDAGTFSGNATKKAVELAKWFSVSAAEQQRSGAEVLVLADDSGLEVDALNGAPGVHSARFAALDSGSPENSSDDANKAKLFQLLKDVPFAKRTARFRCVLALTPVLRAAPATSSPVCAADEFELQTELFEGTCEGRIALAPRGQGGFGYDPLFVPDGYDKTFGELPEAVKNSISHRARALAGLRQAISGNLQRTRTR